MCFKEILPRIYDGFKQINKTKEICKYALARVCPLAKR